ncbi:MAG: secondary thiamine-phosphate synthase enzyme YjbQ [Deltaproteobacteria bacterium]|nr:secondary thiamine-phosphate synthase enzyme YjbQ [Deltaproteobacteria bacterium]
MKTIAIRTTSRAEMIPVTAQLQRLVEKEKWRTGALLVYCPHTTAGLTVNENADPDVQRDMTRFMNTLVPQQGGFRHMEGNSDSHIKTSLFGPHVMLIVEDGAIQLGTWQGVYYCEWDGPRSRKLWVQFLPGSEAL